MSNENNIPLNEKHTVSEDQAVMLILGFKEDTTYEVVGEIYEHTLADQLYEKRETAESEYGNAKYDLYVYEKEIEEGTSKDEQKHRNLKDAIDKKRVLLKATKDREDLAMRYLNLIKNEVVKIKNGKSSLIELDRDESEKMGCSQITKISLINWYAELSEEGIKQESSPTTTDAGETKTGNTAQKNNQITTFLLAKALAELVDMARGGNFISPELDKNSNPINLIKKGGNLNIAALVRYLLDNTDPIDGQKERTLKKRLSKTEQQISPEDIKSIGEVELETTLKEAGNQLAIHNLEEPPYK